MQWWFIPILIAVAMFAFSAYGKIRIAAPSSGCNSCSKKQGLAAE